MILMGMIKHSQSSQKSNFSMSLQYLKKEVKDEVDFLQVYKPGADLELIWGRHTDFGDT